MAICTLCEEEIPKPKRCAHGKKPANCGVLNCLTDYVAEHEVNCQGKKKKFATGLAASVERAKAAVKGKALQGYQEEGDAIGKAYEEIANAATTEVAAATSNGAATTSKENEAIPESSSSALSTTTEEPTFSAAAESMLSEIRRLRCMPTFTSCRHCNTTATAGRRIKKCTGCGVTGYCSKECQSAHWQAVHKMECKALQEVGELEMNGGSKGALMERIEKLFG